MRSRERRLSASVRGVPRRLAGVRRIAHPPSDRCRLSLLAAAPSPVCPGRRRDGRVGGVTTTRTQAGPDPPFDFVSACERREGMDQREVAAGIDHDGREGQRRLIGKRFRLEDVRRRERMNSHECDGLIAAGRTMPSWAGAAVSRRWGEAGFDAHEEPNGTQPATGPSGSVAGQVGDGSDYFCDILSCRISKANLPARLCNTEPRMIDVKLIKAFAEQRVASLDEAACLAGISVVTLLREIRAARGPHVVRPSARRKGVRICDLATWLERRASPTASGIPAPWRKKNPPEGRPRLLLCCSIASPFVNGKPSTRPPSGLSPAASGVQGAPPAAGPAGVPVTMIGTRV